MSQNTALAERQENAPALRVIATPHARATAEHARLNDIKASCVALVHYIDTYKATPAHPVNDEYRAARMERIEEGIEDLRKAMNDG